MRGASTAINAIGDGRKAAQEIIDKAGVNFKTKQDNRRKQQNVDQLMINKAIRKLPQTVIETSLNDRQNFNLVSTTLTEDEAIKEASRCLLCDEVCNICTTVCPNLAFHSFEIEPVKYDLQKVITSGNDVKIIEGETFEVKQKYQILHIADWCNQCGNCDTFCPTAGAPYLEKPHLYLIKEIFEKEKDGYYLDKEGEFPSLIAYHNKQQYRLTLTSEYLIFESEFVKAILSTVTLQVEDIEVKEKTNFELDLIIAAEMSLIMKGAISFYG